MKKNILMILLSLSIIACQKPKEAISDSVYKTIEVDSRLDITGCEEGKDLNTVYKSQVASCAVDAMQLGGFNIMGIFSNGTSKYRFNPDKLQACKLKYADTKVVQDKVDACKEVKEKALKIGQTITGIKGYEENCVGTIKEVQKYDFEKNDLQYQILVKCGENIDKTFLIYGSNLSK